MGFVHADGHDESGGGGEGGGDPDGGAHAPQISDDTAHERTHGVAGVAPDPVDPHGAAPPCGMGDVADHGQ
jgi:hypothetical protein